MHIQGILLPSGWNDDGQVTALILATADEAEIQVECSQPPERLERFFRHKVIVDGEFANSGLLKIQAIDICTEDPASVGCASETI